VHRRDTRRAEGTPQDLSAPAPRRIGALSKRSPCALAPGRPPGVRFLRQNHAKPTSARVGTWMAGAGLLQGRLAGGRSRG
jgi:hypothetical protein